MNLRRRFHQHRAALLTVVGAAWLIGPLAPPVRAADLSEATALYRAGQYAECVDISAKALETDEFREEWRTHKIRAEMTLGRYAEALATLDAALKRFPFSVALRWQGQEVCRFNDRSDRAKLLATEIVELLRQQSWRYRDSANSVVLGRFFLSQGMDPKKVLDGVFNDLRKRQPNFVEAYLASGELALSKHDYALAAETFQQAAKLDPTDPEAHFGLARAYAASDAAKAQAALDAVRERNPRHIGALLLIAEEHIDSERYADAEKILDQVRQVNAHHPRALALRAVLAHLNNQPEVEAEHRDAALKHWPTNPEVDHTIGRKLSQKYRFAEGAEHQRQALKFDADYLPAKMQLAQDLLRLGEEDEGWRLADEVYERDGYNIVAHNLVTLHDSLSKFRTLEEGGFVVRMDAREAEIYGPRVVALLRRARERLCAKYDVTIDRPVIVELFPRQQDFAIRTFGLPGGAGFLGVCFGTVITANSPASQGESPSNWEATLFHEFCHVVTLHKTHNKMPRWLSEGISVYEEKQADPTWGQSLNPRYREMLLADDLTPVSRLSGAFLQPPSPLHLQFAYYQSSLVVEHLVEKYGIEMLQRVLVDLGAGLPINESLARYTGSLDALDAEFAEFARQRAATLAPEADWSDPMLPPRADAATLAAAVEEHPKNYRALGRWARRLIADKEWQAAKVPLEAMLKLYPQDGGADNPSTLLAAVHRELNETQEERAVLEKLSTLSADDREAFARLTELATAAEDWEATLKYAQRTMAVNPLQRATHRSLATAAEKTGDDRLALDSYRALLLLDPIDPADLHYRLATLLHRAGELPAARRHALQAIEEAPRYRAAHRKLLEIVQQIEQNEKRAAREAKPTTSPTETKP